MSAGNPAVAESMQVLACDGRGGMRAEERSVPAVGDGEILIRLRWCGLCGTDLFKLENGLVAEGTVLGHELVGEVAAMGSGVTEFELGERVVSTHHVACGVCPLCRRGSVTKCETFLENLLEPGGYAELVLLRPRAVRCATWRVPDSVSDEAATFLEPSACVLRAVDRAHLGSGEPGCVAIIGAGSMGLLHLLVIRAALPWLRVVVCDPIAERRELAITLGADAGIADEKQAFAEIENLSRGLGADAVFDTVGGSGPLKTALKLLRPGGTAVLFAHGKSHEEAGFELNALFKNEQRVVGAYSAGITEQKRIARLMEAGHLDPSPLATRTVRFNEIETAIEMARSRRALKILIGPEEG
jgi:L-iditol 2-dehydrogenase